MRKWINEVFRIVYRRRYRSIRRYMDDPHPVQEALFRQLLSTARQTEWGLKYDYRSIRNAQTYADRVPVQTYDDIKPFIRRMMRGEKDVLWTGAVRWYAKSSGTTSDKSKFIPVTAQNLKECHLRGSWDTTTLLYQNVSNARVMELKSMIMGGSLTRYPEHPSTMYGDVSAIMIHHLPLVGRPFFAPDIKTATLPDWEEKLERLARYSARERRIVMIGGVPTWTVVLFRRILEITGKQNMLEVWPDFQVYVHGGVSFMPYVNQFKGFFPSEQVHYQEIYNASEGFFAIQDDLSRNDMLLLLDNGIYYEFLPMTEWDAEAPRAVPLSEVELGKNYALVISTNSGLWRYLPGDTVQFTSKYPYRIRVTGRTKQFVNAFGEEVMVDNTEKALAETCRTLDAIVAEYTVAPVYFKEADRGGHEWLVEFEKQPRDLKRFQELLDLNLQKVNSDYEAKRHKNLALQQLRLRALPRGVFHRWMRARGKFGGQHKVPRLANHRQYVEEILNMLEEKV